ncbi:hypothetical protein [Nitrospina gracilis]|uniref:hypothetical protein n=1 Tax=Nitrospina gracilis TaxID=35801 RepID=UPI001F1696B8|nr:hypothetical protein [Nitrospina gracilis]
MAIALSKGFGFGFGGPFKKEPILTDGGEPGHLLWRQSRPALAIKSFRICNIPISFFETFCMYFKWKLSGLPRLWQRFIFMKFIMKIISKFSRPGAASAPFLRYAVTFDFDMMAAKQPLSR